MHVDSEGNACELDDGGLAWDTKERNKNTNDTPKHKKKVRIRSKMKHNNDNKKVVSCVAGYLLQVLFAFRFCRAVLFPTFVPIIFFSVHSSCIWYLL